MNQDYNHFQFYSNKKTVKRTGIKIELKKRWRIKIEMNQEYNHFQFYSNKHNMKLRKNK